MGSRCFAAAELRLLRMVSMHFLEAYGDCGAGEQGKNIRFEFWFGWKE